MPLGGLVLNRVHPATASGLGAERAIAAAESLEEAGDNALVAATLRLHAERAAVAAREQRLRSRFTSAHPSIPVAEVTALAGDVHDLDGLREVSTDLAGAADPSAA
jgi:hypothetical protein